MRRPVHPGAIAALLACQAIAVLTPIPARAGDDPRFALVWDNARLHHRPDATSPWVRLFTFDDASRPDRTGQVHVMQLLGEEGDFARVANLQYLDGTCSNYGTHQHAYGFQLELYVARADLAPVLHRRTQIDFDDGTGVDLDPGVALRTGTCADETCGVLARVDGVLLDLEIPEGHVDRWYSPDATRGVGNWTGERIRLSAPILLDGRPVERLDGHHTLQDVRNREPLPSGALVTVDGMCGNYRFAVGEDAFVDSSDAQGLLALLGSMGGGTQVDAMAHVVPAGTPMEHPDGSPAGRVVDEQVFFTGGLEPLPGDGTDRLCTSLLLGGGFDSLAPMEERTLPLCFQPGHVRREMRKREDPGLDSLFGAESLEDIGEVLRNTPGVEVAPARDDDGGPQEDSP